MKKTPHLIRSLKILVICSSVYLVGCASTRPLELYDSVSVQSTPDQATVYIKRVDQAFTELELQNNPVKTVDHDSVFTPVAEQVEAEVPQQGETTVLVKTTPAMFTLQKLGKYVVAVSKEGYPKQEYVLIDKLTGGEVAGNVAKVAGTAVGGSLLTLLVPPVGLAVLAGSAAKKGQNMKSGKNKELVPNPLVVDLEAPQQL